MKWNILISLIIIGILVVWGVTSDGFEHNPLDTFYSFSLENKTVEETLPDGYLKIEYPLTKYEVLNEAIKTFVDSEQKSFKENIKGLTTISSAKGNLEINYKSYLSDRIISLQFDESMDTGGAHGNFTTTTFNYDIKLNKILKTQDLFKDPNQYLQNISSIVKPRLKLELEKIQFQDDIWLEEGAGPKEVNYKQFVCTADGITFFFNPYQVAPYAAGAQDITITYPELVSYLLSEYSQLKF